MESFREATNAANSAVHTGFWTDWSYGSIFGATITLNKRDGSLLIAFIALFVSLVGTSFWRLCCFALHQLYSTNLAQDALYHQRQAIFRNAANGTSGLWGLLAIWWKWRKTAVDRPSQRLLPAVGFAICCVGAFAAAGTFSSKISTAANSVLIRSPDCGIIAGGSKNHTELDGINYFFPWVYQLVTSWAVYAQNCLLHVSDLGSCNAFIKPQLPVKIQRNATCPFRDDICVSEYGNIVFDTFINSHFDLGLNAPPHERILFRRVSSCAPIKTHGYSDMYYSPETSTSYARYYYGSFMNTTNFTYEYPIVNWNSTGGFRSGQGDTYIVKTISALLTDGSYVYPSRFQPISALSHHDEDVHLIFLSADNILYTEKVNDPWYAANKRYREMRFEESGKLGAYAANKLVSVLACSVKEQYCNPNLPPDKQCSPFGGIGDSAYLAHDLWKGNTKQHAAFKWISSIIFQPGMTIETVPDILGASALLARYKTANGFSARLPDNQWQLETESWHAATLVGLQGIMTQTAKGFSDENLKSYVNTPTNPDQQDFCNNQKIPSGAYYNFSVFGLSFTLALGSLIISLSYSIESLTSWVQKRRNSGTSNYAHLEWVTHETLQLQRQAYEQSGIGVWEGCASRVPVTKGGETLVALDLEDADCPRLNLAPLQEVVVEEAVQPGAEDAGKDDEQKDESEHTAVPHDSEEVDDSTQSGNDGEEPPEGSVTDVSSIISGLTRDTGVGN